MPATSTYIDDSVLMSRLQGGDVSALEGLLERHSGRLHRYLARMLRDEEMARETVQDTFMRVYQKADLYAPRARFTTWLFRIGYNLAISNLRRKRVPTVSISAPEGADLDFAAAGEGPEQAVATGQTRARIEAAIAALPPKLRDAFVLFDVHQMSIKEVADRLDCPEGTVKARVFRARRRLREALQDLDPALTAAN